MTPAVSVIIPAYGVADYIGAALDSVIRQTFRDYEIIVVNDGCQNTLTLEHALLPYADKIIYVKKENGGPSSARNAGIHQSRAPLVALLDGDDEWESDYLAFQTAILCNDLTADAVYPNAVYFGDTPRVGRELMEFSPSKGDVTFESLISRRCCPNISVTARKEAFIRAGCFDEDLRRAEDFDMWLRIVKAGGRIVYHSRPLLRYRRREGTLSSDDVLMRESGLVVLEKAERTLDLSPAERAALAVAKRSFRGEIAYLSGIGALDIGDVAKAIAAFRQMNQSHWTLKNTLRIALLRSAPSLAVQIARQRSVSVDQRAASTPDKSLRAI